MSVLDFLGFGSASSINGSTGWFPSFWGHKTTAGIDVNEVTANNYSAVWAATRVLAATGAALPLNLKRKSGRDKQTAKDHPVHKMIHSSPNSETIQMLYMSTMIDWQVNWGNAYSEIVWDAETGRPSELYPIHPGRVEPMRDENGRLVYEVTNPDGTKDGWLPEDLLHVPSIKSFDGVSGVGVIQHARESIGFGLAVEKQGAAYFKNGGRPVIAITGGKFKDDEARKFYREQWAEVHSGPENNGKPLLLPTDSAVTQMQFSAEDSQFLQTREHNVEVIARWYGVPPHMIGDLRRATFSNIEHQNIEFVVYSLIPWLVMWEQEIKKKLLSPTEQKSHFVKFNVEGLLRGDQAARADYYTSMFQLGAISSNEIRDREDLNPIEGGDQYFVPLNMVSVEEAGKPEEEPIEPEPAASTNPDAMAKLLAYMEQSTPEAETPNVAEQWLVADFQRATAKERKDINRAANKEKNFLGWMDAYYDKYEPQLCDAIANAAKAANVNRFEIAAEHCRQSKEQLLTAAEVPAEEFTSKVQALTAEWESRQPLELNNVA